MAQVELIMPKMGESIIEATILNWVKNVGDHVEVDETVLEIATDKVDSEVPSPVEGTIVKLLYDVEDVVEIGKPIAIIETEGDAAGTGSISTDQNNSTEEEQEDQQESEASFQKQEPVAAKKIPDISKNTGTQVGVPSQSDRFYSPLVRNIAQAEGISQAELDSIAGTGMNDRVTKSDILAYLESRDTKTASTTPKAATVSTSKVASKKSSGKAVQDEEIVLKEGEEIIEMGRMRKLIADHMVTSKHTSPHVTSFVEADVTNLVQWREKNKKPFIAKYGENITYTPLFMEAIVKGIRDFPGVNVSVKGDKIIMKHYVNLGMAVARPDGNLIVPVIHDADELNLLGLTRRVNDLADRARNDQLKPAEIQGGTFTLTNVGGFGNVMGTPIINQPQVAILATGTIKKKPAVIETENGDTIGIRHKMFLSLSYDHRVVDGMMGGSFLRRVADYLEAFDEERTI